jgi:hypothetical protein
MLRTSPTSFIATEAISAGARVKFTAGSVTHVELADEGDVEIGTALLHSGKSSYAAGTAVGVALIEQPGTRHCIAASAIAAGAVVKRADDGMVNDTGNGNNFGQALEAATAAGDVIEVLCTPGVLVTPADASVTPAKLADSLADVLPALSVTVANAGTPNGTATVTIQAKDAQGNNLAARVKVEAWFSATSYGAPTDLGTLTATTGTILKAHTTDALIEAVTDATGLLVLSYDLTADGNLFCMATATGLCAAGNAAITGN